MLTLLKNQKEEIRLAKSSLIAENLFGIPEFQQSTSILFYASFDGEVNTLEMIKRARLLGKRIGLPRIIKEKSMFTPIFMESIDEGLEDGPYGIKQPKESGVQSVDMKDIDMVIVPGVAFDRQRNRLGRGGGYYDRFLKTLDPDTVTVGLAFDFQVVDVLPEQCSHDVPVSHLICN